MTIYRLYIYIDIYIFMSIVVIGSGVWRRHAFCFGLMKETYIWKRLSVWYAVPHTHHTIAYYIVTCPCMSDDRFGFVDDDRGRK